MAKAKKLFTIGYEQTPAKAVLDELVEAGVKLLVDVRAVASSRRPGFSKTQLAAGLDERGIAYLHLRGLGTPKEGREAARSGKYDVLEKIYTGHLKTTQAREELDELSALVRKSGPVCILCYERDHQHCHRRWIAEIIEDRDGVKIENLAAPQI
jgi:uncharacterized protein (DUF488 family)